MRAFLYARSDHRFVDLRIFRDFDEAASKRLWSRCGPEVVWASTPEYGVVFDPTTGSTHFLSELPALLLSTITDTPESSLNLLERLVGPITVDRKEIAKITAALSYLEAAELVESR